MEFISYNPEAKNFASSSSNPSQGDGSSPLLRYPEAKDLRKLIESIANKRERFTIGSQDFRSYGAVTKKLNSFCDDLERISSNAETEDGTLAAKWKEIVEDPQLRAVFGKIGKIDMIDPLDDLNFVTFQDWADQVRKENLYNNKKRSNRLSRQDLVHMYNCQKAARDKSQENVQSLDSFVDNVLMSYKNPHDLTKNQLISYVQEALSQIGHVSIERLNALRGYAKNKSKRTVQEGSEKDIDGGIGTSNQPRIRGRLVPASVRQDDLYDSANFHAGVFRSVESSPGMQIDRKGQEESANKLLNESTLVIAYLNNSYRESMKKREDQSLQLSSLLKKPIELTQAVSAWLTMQDEMNKDIWKTFAMKDYQNDINKSITERMKEK